MQSESQTFTRSAINIRPAQPSDRAALEAIAAQTWEGSDYLPRVLDTWFNDPDGGFYVVTIADRVIGVGKMTRYGDGEWWMEGLRIDPAFQGQGLARVLHHFILNQVRQVGSGVVRFSTASNNQAVGKLASETGFQLVGKFMIYWAAVLDEPAEGLRKLGEPDLPRLRAWLKSSAYYGLVQHSIESEWSYQFLTDERLAARLKSGLVYGWLPTDQIAGVVIFNENSFERFPSPNVIKVGYLDAALPDWPLIVRDARRVAAALGSQEIQLKVLDQPERIAAIEQAGFVNDWEDGLGLLLYSREISLTQKAEVRTENLPPVEK